MDWLRSLGMKVVGILAALAVIAAPGLALAHDDDCAAAAVGAVAVTDGAAAAVGAVAVACD